MLKLVFKLDFPQAGMTEGYRSGLKAVGGHGVHELKSLEVSAAVIVVAIIAMMLVMMMG